MQANVDDGPRQHAHATLLLGGALQRREESEFISQFGGVAGPPFRHRPAEKHADATRAVDGGDLANARMRTVGGMSVLHVVSERAVVHDMVERDGTVIPGLEATFALVGRDRVIDRRDQIQMLRARLVRRRRAVEQEVELRRDLAGPQGDRHVAERPVGPFDQVVRERESATGVELRRERGQVARRGRAILGECGPKGIGAARDFAGQRDEARLGRRHCRLDALQQSAGRLRAEVSALQQDVVRFDADGVAGVHIARQSMQPLGRQIEGLRRSRGNLGECRTLLVIDCVFVLPQAQVAAQERRKHARLSHGAINPDGRHRLRDRAPHIAKERRDGREAGCDGIDAAFDRLRWAQQQRHDAEDRFAGPERGVPVVEEAGLCFEDTHVDVRASQLGVERVGVRRQQAVTHRWKRRKDRVVQLRQLGDFGVARSPRPIGKTMVLRV